MCRLYRQHYDGTAGSVTDKALQMLITRRLRVKIEPGHNRRRYIIIVRGEGYRFVESET